MKKILLILLAAALLQIPAFAVDTLSDDAISIDAPSAILIEKTTGTVIYEKNACEHLSPASVTKVMTMLLVAEAVDNGLLSLDDMVTASARAAGMGGSQIWLEEGEQMTVGEMLKCVAVVSANDCCVALAEHIAGSEEAFVARMNQRAAELGMNDTHFTCCSGLLESDDHYTCARDIAVMSRELLKHEFIKDYTTIWMDTIRDGAFGLSNTNKLIYHYAGATGLKTGFTSKAMYCLSASAERDGVEYIAVVLHAPSSAARFESAKTLLNYAFANYTLCPVTASQAIPPVRVTLGKADCVQPVFTDERSILLEKGVSAKLEYALSLPESVDAPVAQGQELGSLKVYSGGQLIDELPLVADGPVEKLGVWGVFLRLADALCGAAK
ncbi:MAG: D-alanyl-D-alanine carboxypeptidase family protein [Oscillospiraceae bacterium]